MSNSNNPFKKSIEDFYYPQLYLPSQDFITHDKYKTSGGVVDVNYTFKKAMRVIAYQQDGNIEGIMEELGLSYEDSLFFLKGTAVERWKHASAENDDRLGLTAEERAKIYEKEKTFDYLIDFDAYYPDFIEFFHIDLLTEDISFIQFNWMLTSLMAKENSAIGKRLQYRTYKPSKHDSSEYTKYMSDMKRTYAFTEQTGEDIFQTMKKGGK